MTLKELGFNDIDHEALAKTHTPYKIYAELLDETAQKQFEDVLNVPYVTRGALMPDAHAGYTMPIGAVYATKDRLYLSLWALISGVGCVRIRLTTLRQRWKPMPRRYITPS